MSQLVVQPGRNAARQAKKLKEIRKVERAITWSQRERKKRQTLHQERWDSKQAVLQRVRWDNKNVKEVRETALKNAKEDWKLGNLRPNRAIGDEVDKYGALTGEQIQKPEIPVHTQRNRNEARLKRGLEPIYPLVVDDMKYFHVVTGDRVVVVNGREKGKMGVVRDVIERTHEVIVAGVNMQYYDSNVFSSVGEDMGPKRENEVPFPVTDVRLVIPYKFTQIKIVVNVAGVEEVRPVTLVKDVVVDNLVMKRHTTGIDPFTGTDHGAAEIPKDHQYDPSTGLPIFHRYIAGTEHLGLDYHLEWPWQREAPVEDSGKTEEEADDIQTRFRRLMSTWRHPFDSFKRIRSRQPEVKASAEPEGPHWTEADQEALSKRRTEKVKSHDPGFSEAWDVTDTTRNIVEANDTMVYKILESPLPPSLHQELRTDISSFNVEARKDKDAPRPVKVKRSTAKGTEASELAKARFVAAQRMKTPMQLRWELEQARKAKMVKKEPLVKEEDLLAALGAHVQTWQKAKKAESARKGKGVEEVD